jgi:hypothetical protein
MSFLLAQNTNLNISKILSLKNKKTKYFSNNNLPSKNKKNIQALF